MANDIPQEETIVEEVVEETPLETPQEETTKEESPADESPEEEETETSVEESVEEEGEKEAPPQISRRKAKRLEKLESLVERLKTAETPVQEQPGIDYRELLDTEPEVYDQLDAKTQEYGTGRYNAGLEQAKAIQFHTRLEIDAPKVEAKYPQFDKESTEFNPAIANAINQWYLSAVGYDPKTERPANANVRYLEFVEGIMELADNMATAKTSNTRKNIAKQAGSTGLRPDGSSAKTLNLNKDPKDMTDEELSAVISRSLPKN